MRLSSRAPRTLFPSLFLIPSLAAALTLDCENIVVDGVKFSLGSLQGPHSVTWTQEHPPIIINTNLTLDICQPLKQPKGTSKDAKCPNGTNLCAIQYKDKEEEVLGVIPIAGNYLASIGGGSLDPKYTRLKTSSSHADSELEGIRLEIGGGKYQERKQRAIIEFICPKDGSTERREDDGKEDESKKPSEPADDGKGGKIKFRSYEPDPGAADQDLLRLEWDTKYACEDTPKEKTGTHWGFFTWMFVIIFLSLAAYLIFGSWLNYNRYGARGWDLFPHGDTLRDVPYMIQDWGRKVKETVSGGGTRGGYSAV